MKKLIYEKPAMYMEEFVPNQRIANCGTIIDTSKAYSFVCAKIVDGQYQGSCNGGSQHNVALPTIFASASAGCKEVITATTPEGIMSAINSIMTANASEGGWAYQLQTEDLNGDGNKKNDYAWGEKW